uniref:dITP/XTP pyrophosphatase n=1 Tax=Cyanothece sp. (strain PCC 7425 / ATCC 29141) TaxID=395961 RepID=B8HK28_CYAP4
MPILVVASHNPGKVKEFQTYFQDLPWQLILMPADLEIEETGETFADNACLKASTVARLTGNWAIADDSGLEVAALNGQPGVYSARYGATDPDRIQRLLTELGQEPNRTARFVCAIAVARPTGEIALQTEGVCPGEILSTPQGEGGFGYDPIFYVPEKQMTFAQMPSTVKQQISHRGRALRSLLPQLSLLLNRA